MADENEKIPNEGDGSENPSVKTSLLTIKPTLQYQDIIDRIENGNSQKCKYDFEWDIENLLNYADDESLEISIQMLEKGSFELIWYEEKKYFEIRTEIQGLCNVFESQEKLAEIVSNFKPKGLDSDKKNCWRYYSPNRQFDSDSCYNCPYSSCPKVLSACLLYFKNNGVLNDKLIERKKFRDNELKHNGHFLFDWTPTQGLELISEDIYQLALECVNNDLIYVYRGLWDGRIKIESKIGCDDFCLSSNFDDLQNRATSDFSHYLNRSTESDITSFCSDFSCRLNGCPWEVAGYIYYLMHSEQSDVIERERQYYNEHKEEVDDKVRERVESKLQDLIEKKETSIKDFKSFYGDKIKNIDMLLGSILESPKTNFHYMVIGEEQEERNECADKIIELLQKQNSSLVVRKMSLFDFTSLFYHWTRLSLDQNSDNIHYFDVTKSENYKTKKDIHGIPYISDDNLQTTRANVLEDNVIYVLDGIQDFINEAHYYLITKKDNVKAFNNAFNLLADVSNNKFIILKGNKNEIDPFLELDTKLKFVYQDNIVELPSYSIEDMYKGFVTALSDDVRMLWNKDEEKNKKHFIEYVTLNQRFVPFTRRGTVNYLATYLNVRGGVILPKNIYKKENFDDLIGLEKVKKKVRDFESFMLFQIQAKENGIDVEMPNLHMVFSGNPGTGKTTVARKMAKMLYDLGIIKENKLIEVERKDLIAQYTGQTAIKTAEVIDKAMNGVLFIDEAYTLALNDSFSPEAIATLIKAMEDHKDKLVVIFAGYKDEMYNFINANPGIASRIGYKFEFEDYSVNELMQIFNLKMNKAGFECDTQINDELKRICGYFSKKRHFGNARFINKVVQETLVKHALRKPENIYLITEEDIPTIEDLSIQLSGSTESKTASEMLDNIIGMANIKEETLNFGNYVSFVKKAEEQNLSLPPINMHMIFTGNPGTGKTTIARIIAKMLFDLGVLHENKLVEVERKDLVAGYVGQTAIKTNEVIEKALGGVLFIDEAYSLAREQGSSHDFGGESIATLIKAMEDHKGEFVVIFAGYKDEMREFINTNPGIASRIGYIFNFEDYDDTELTQIFEKKVLNMNFSMEEGVLEEVKSIMKYFYKVENFGNGRFVDKVLSKTLVKHATRLSSCENMAEKIAILEKEDLPSIQEITKFLLDGDSMIDVSKITPESLRKTAIHEVGHAAVGHLLLNIGFKKITCTAEGIGSLGYVEMKTDGASYTNSKEKLFNRIKMLLAGIASEEVFLGHYENGGSSDLEKATNIARNIITIYGMSDLGLVHITNDNKALEPMIYEEESKILNQCFVDVKELIVSIKDKMSNVVDYLLEHGSISEEEFIDIFEKEAKL